MREFWSGIWAAMESPQITLAVKTNVRTGNESSKIVHYGPIIQKLLRLLSDLQANPFVALELVVDAARSC
jgi:hypothetical protein